MTKLSSLCIFLSLFLLTACGQDDTVIIQQSESRGYTQDLENTSEKIKNTQAFEDCLRPSINMCVSQVGNQLAREQNSPDLCNEISDVSNREACKYGVIVTQVLATKSIDPCSTLSDSYKHECRVSFFLSEAITTNDPLKCDQIATESGAGIQSGSLAIRVDQCRADVIMRTPTSRIEDCAKIQDTSRKAMCRSVLTRKNQ